MEETKDKMTDEIDLEKELEKITFRKAKGLCDKAMSHLQPFYVFGALFIFLRHMKNDIEITKQNYLRIESAETICLLILLIVFINLIRIMIKAIRRLNK